jgi:hypothetical protein
LYVLGSCKFCLVISYLMFHDYAWKCIDYVHTAKPV